MLISSCSIFRTDSTACLECQGMGRIHKPCAWCNSTGICLTCKGTGFIKCPYCMNGGKYIDNKWQICTVCQGKGDQWRSCFFVVTGVYSVREYAIAVNQNMLYAYIVKNKY